MSKCVLYEPAVRVPLIVRPPGGCAPRVVDSLVEQLDVPATVRAIAGAPDVAGSEGQSLLGVVGGGAPPVHDVAVSENWGFAVFETERHKLVVDEDAVRAVPALRPGRGPGRGPRPARATRWRRTSSRSSWRRTCGRSSGRRRRGRTRASSRAAAARRAVQFERRGRCRADERGWSAQPAAASPGRRTRSRR